MPVKYEPWAIKNEKDDLWGFKLLEGNYTGTIISINSVEMDDKSDDGTVALDFNFVQRPKGKTEEDLNSSELFFNFSQISFGMVLSIGESMCRLFQRSRILKSASLL